MDTEAEFTTWLERLASGDETAATLFWDRYFERLIQMAKKKFETLPRRAVDEEDVALSAMNSVLRGIQNGQFAKLQDAQAIWKLLLTITSRKITAQRRREFSAKRGGGRQRGESVFTPSPNTSGVSMPFQEITSHQPSPDLIAILHDTTSQFIKRLDDPQLERILLLTLEGSTPKEIAEQLGVVPATVLRKLSLIRERFRQMSDEQTHAMGTDSRPNTV